MRNILANLINLINLIPEPRLLGSEVKKKKFSSHHQTLTMPFPALPPLVSV